MWLKNTELYWMDTLKLDGYMRKGFYSNMMGMQMKNVSTICHFNFVLYQSKKSCHDILVEIRHGVGKRSDTGIDPKWMRNLLKGTDFEEYFVEIEGRPFIKGEFVRSVPGCRPSLHVAECSNAYRLLNFHGNVLATAFAFRDKVESFQEAERLNELLLIVREYVYAMNPHGSHQAERNVLEQKIAHVLEEMDSLDRGRAVKHQEYSEAVEVLRKHGIDYEH